MTRVSLVLCAAMLGRAAGYAIPPPLSTTPPATPGDRLSDIRTPALLVRESAFKTNLATVHKVLQPWPGVAVRPHGKAHKCVEVAQQQVASGCVGVCAAKLGEARVFLEGGVRDVLLSNQLVGQVQADRFAALCAAHAQARVSVCVDSVEGVDELARAAEAQGVSFPVLVEVNVGQNRAGVEPSEVLALVQHVLTQAPHLSFGGIQAYMGLNQHVRRREQRREASEMVASKVRHVTEALKDAGIECPCVTGAGTGTFELEAEAGALTEVQPGSYAFMDVDYSKNEDMKKEVIFKHSLFLLSTVHSVSSQGWAVCDGGTKAVSYDSGPPRAVDLEGGDLALSVECAGDEHSKILPAEGESLGLKRGDKLLLIPGHCDPTVNLHDWLVFVDDDGGVTSVHPVSARGPGV